MRQMTARRATDARWILALAVSVGMAAPAAAALTEDVPVVGGTAAFAQSLGITPAPDAPRFIGELTRLIYNVPEGRSPSVDAVVRLLVSHLELIRHFQQLVALAGYPTGDLSLARAAQKDPRDRLNNLFDFIGLKMRERNLKFVVEPANSKPAAQRLQLLT